MKKIIHKKTIPFYEFVKRLAKEFFISLTSFPITKTTTNKNRMYNSSVLQSIYLRDTKPMYSSRQRPHSYSDEKTKCTFVV